MEDHGTRYQKVKIIGPEENIDHVTSRNLGLWVYTSPLHYILTLVFIETETDFWLGNIYSLFLSVKVVIAVLHH